MPTQTITRQQVIDLVMALPTHCLISVYDFARFVQSHSLESTPATDIFGQTEEEIRADEVRWDQQFAASREELQAMAREAAVEYRTGKTRPMEFTPEGRLIR